MDSGVLICEGPCIDAIFSKICLCALHLYQLNLADIAGSLEHTCGSLGPSPSTVFVNEVFGKFNHVVFSFLCKLLIMLNFRRFGGMVVVDFILLF